MDVDRLLAEEAAEWARLTEVVARVPDERFEEPTVTPEGWSPKDVMFHVAYWMADCADVLERIAAGTWDGGGDETPPTIETTNREGFERSRAMPADEVRAGFEDGAPTDAGGVRRARRGHSRSLGVVRGIGPAALREARRGSLGLAGPVTEAA